MGFKLEVCVDSVRSAMEAEAGGADRLELCKSLVTGGISPGVTLLRQVKEYTELPVRVLVRPRFGDFCYDRYETEEMRRDIRLYREAGADGVVIGMLTPEGELDLEGMRVLAEAAGEMDVALHRAFDMCRDPFRALRQARELGVKTILTSGQRASAFEGRELLRELVRRAEGEIEILAGAGIKSCNIRELAEFVQAPAYHMSGKITMDSRMEFRRNEVNMGLPGLAEYDVWQTAREEIGRAVKELEEVYVCQEKH